MKTWILFLGLVSTQVIRGSTAPSAVYQVKEDDSFTFRWDVDTDANMASTNLLCTQLSRPLRTLYELVQGVEVQDSQHQHFAQRVTFDKDALRANQIRLHLSRVNMADSGRYLCDVRADYNKRTRTWRLSTSKYFELDVTSGGTRGHEDPDSPESRPGEPVVMGSPERYRAKVGYDVVLQCRLEPPLDVTNMLVEWRQNQTIVHVYRNGKDDPDLQNERFRGRTSLFHQEMTRGNISLKLSRVTEEDSGEFTCFIPKLEKGRVTLDVGRTVCDWAVAFTIFFLPLVAVIATFIIVDRAKPMKRRDPDLKRNGVDRIRPSSRRHDSGSAGERKKHPVSKPDLSPDASQKKCHIIIIGTTVIIIGIILTITTWTLNLKRLCFFNK